MGKNPTIHDLASDLNISATTVWRALNNQNRVSAKTRALVNARALAINYEPSLVAQNLSHGRTSTLGIIVPKVGHPIFSVLAEVIEQAAFDRGYNVILCNASRGHLQEAEYTRMLYRRRVEGVVAIPLGPHTTHPKNWDSLLAELEQRSIPVVLLEQNLPSNHYPTVIADNYRAAYNMTRHLIGLGHKSLALAAHSGSDLASIWLERLAGFNQALAEAGLTEKARLIPDAYAPDQKGVLHYRPDLISRCFDRPDRPTAIFALSDILAIQIMETLRKMNLNVPRDVAVAGFDDITFSEHTIPPLTTVQQPTEEMARRAAEILFELIDAKSILPPKPICERIPCHLIIRESCGAHLQRSTP
jgi:DNA-binding LacI/PurR family transcriptional regulator